MAGVQRYGDAVRTAVDTEDVRRRALSLGPTDSRAQMDYEAAVARDLADTDIRAANFHPASAFKSSSLARQHGAAVGAAGEAAFALAMLELSQNHSQRGASLTHFSLEQSRFIVMSSDAQGTVLPTTWDGTLTAALDQGRRAVSLSLSSPPGNPRMDAFVADFSRHVDEALAPQRRLIQSLYKQVADLRISARRLQIADKYSFDVSTVWLDLVLEALSRDASADVYTMELLTTAVSSSATLSSIQRRTSNSSAPRSAAAQQGGAASARRQPRQQQQQQQQQQQDRRPVRRRQPSSSRPRQRDHRDQDRSRSPPRRQHRSHSGDRRQGEASSRGGERGRENHSRGRR
jgi:hypothetical protein